jgi:Domain of unknown function (DUF4326)
VTGLVRDRLPGSIYIGRLGKGEAGTFGNPYAIGEVCARCWQLHRDAASTIPCFRLYFLERVDADSEFRSAVLGLRGKLLWCPGRCTPRPCHGRVILEWLESQP